MFPILNLTSDKSVKPGPSYLATVITMYGGDNVFNLRLITNFNAESSAVMSMENQRSAGCRHVDKPEEG
jgi:hypothetical protein